MPSNLNYDKVPHVLIRKLLSAANCLCGHGGFPSSWIWRKQNIKLSPDLWRWQGPPRSQQTMTDFKPLFLELKKKKEGTERAGLFSFSHWTLFITLKQVLSKGNGCGAMPSILFVWGGGRMELQRLAWPHAPGTVLIVLQVSPFFGGWGGGVSCDLWDLLSPIWDWIRTHPHKWTHRQSPNHWTTREFPRKQLNYYNSYEIVYFLRKLVWLIDYLNSSRICRWWCLCHNLYRNKKQLIFPALRIIYEL